MREPGDWKCDVCEIDIGATRSNIAITLMVQSPPNSVADLLDEELMNDGIVDRFELLIYGDKQRQRIEVCYDCYQRVVVGRDFDKYASFIAYLESRAEKYR